MSNQEFKYSLEKYRNMSMKFKCPQCKKKGALSRYIDNETKEYLADHVGMCDRIEGCKYHFTPKMFFAENGYKSDVVVYVHKPKIVAKPISFIDADVVNESLFGYELNKFTIYLTKLFGIEKSLELAHTYRIGTSNHWPGSTVFWQIDLTGKVRAGKIMLYNNITGKRIKEPFSHLTWIHKSLNLLDFNLSQCFFGLHLLSDKSKPIAIVESEKTAIIASAYLPQFVWLACGSLQGLNNEKCGILNGRRVILYPDLKAFDKWSIKAKEFNFQISDILERHASDQDRDAGLDIADYLIRFQLSDFQSPELETKIININKQLIN